MFRFSELKLHLDLTVLVGALLVVSCSGDEREPVSHNLPVRFSSGLSGLAETRAANDSWEAGDQVGIYMVPHVANASATADFSRYAGKASNVPYVTSGNGTSVSFSVASEHEAIVYPADGSPVNFVAYYPYRADTHTTNSNVYKVDVSNQSSAKAIDLLCHKGTGTAYDRDDENVALAFTHQLSKLKVSLVPASGVTTDLSGTTLTLSGFPTTANFNLSTGVLSNPGGTTKSFTPVKDASASTSEQAVFEAIVVPHSGASYTRDISFRIGDTNYSCAFPASSMFEAGIAYHYTFQFTGSKVVLKQKIIVDWKGGIVIWGDYRLTADKIHFDLPAEQTSGNTITISTNAPSAPTWTLSGDANNTTTDEPEWITGVLLSDPTSDSNGWKSYTLTFDTDHNSNSDAVARTGYIRLEFAGLTLAIRITQAGTALNVGDPTHLSFSDVSAYGTTGNVFTILTNAQDKDITVTTTDPLIITNLTKERGQVSIDGYSTWTIGFKVSGNTTSSTRSATISTTIGGITKTVPVLQMWGITNVHDGLTNCYMITPGSSVTIPVTRAITIGGMSASDLATATVSTLWDDNGVIRGTPTLSVSDASCTIEVKTSNYDHGNAVIALKDAAGTIYWSWHIWVINDDPTKDGYTYMDRNLGATEAELSPAGWGLQYQWNRKDPFPSGRVGTAGYDALGSFNNASTINHTSATDAGILESIRNPTTRYDTNPGYMVQRPWTTTEYKKSVTDPCPQGWKIHTGSGGITVTTGVVNSTYEYLAVQDIITKGSYRLINLGLGDILYACGRYIMDADRGGLVWNYEYIRQDGLTDPKMVGKYLLTMGEIGRMGGLLSGVRCAKE
jgi:hypothetical protein